MSIARHVGLTAPVAVWLLALAVAPGNALAQPAEQGPGKAERVAARDAYDKGTVSFERGDFVAALDSFVKANALIPSVQALYWIAQAQDKLGRTEAAIEAYEAITARADFAKLTDDKTATVRARLAALKTPTPPPVDVPPAPEAAPAATEPPPLSEPPLVSQPPSLPVESSNHLKPKKNTAELGVMGGVLFVSSSHNLVGPGKTQRELDGPAVQVGVRAAFFPVTVFGVEAEWAHGFAEVKDGVGIDGGSADFDAVRGHLVGQLPGARVVPFALLGAGLLHGSSDQNGSDADFLLQAGAGLKVHATKLLVPRLDLRLNMSQKAGGKFSDGIALHPEVLLGLSFTLGR